MPAIDFMTVSIIYITAIVILLVGYLTAVSSKDIVRLLIALELMFGAVFMSLIPLFSVLPDPAFGVALLTIFASGGELLVLSAAIVIHDRRKRSISTSSVSIGGDNV